jgi:hypothetical protein
MEEQQADRRIRAYTALEALRSGLSDFDRSGPLGNLVDALFVGQFDTALEHLAAIGEDIEEYRVPAAALRGQNNQLVDGDYLLARVKAVLGYFTLREVVLEQARETDERLQTLIGFQTPGSPRSR